MDTRTDAERAYDALRDGSVYQKPAATPAPRRQPPNVVIATLDGMVVEGTCDTDGSPMSVVLTAAEGVIAAGGGHISARWADQDLELDPHQIAALRALFSGNLLPLLCDLADVWTGGQ